MGHGQPDLAGFLRGEGLVLQFQIAAEAVILPPLLHHLPVEMQSGVHGRGLAILPQDRRERHIHL